MREIVETGCLSQNARNITLAREALAQLPPDWAAQHLPEVVSACLFQELGWEEWEFRRLAEMLEEGFPAAFAWLLDYAGNLYDPEVDEAVVDYRAAGASLK